MAWSLVAKVVYVVVEMMEKVVEEVGGGDGGGNGGGVVEHGRPIGRQGLFWACCFRGLL